MDPNNTKSLQNLLQVPTVIYNNSSSIRSKSLPNIFFISYFDTQINKSINPQESIKKHPKPKILKKTWDKVKTAIIHTTSSHSIRRGSLRSKQLDKPSTSSSAPSTPMHKSTFDFENNRQSIAESVDESTPSQYERLKSNDNESEEFEEETEKIQRNYAQLQKRLSVELHQRMSEHKPDHNNKHTTENLSEDFRKKLQQWEMWKVSTGKVTYTDEELQQILPEEFSKKLHEWECIKTSGVSPYGGHHSKTSADSSISHQSNQRGTSSPETPSYTSNKNKLLRKKKNLENSRQKELAWLEKQLEKIEVEKKRLEREMKKYVEREARLQKMKEALQNTSPNEVWIRTPTANCKVEKLTEKFTKKLYEWEEKQGIQPESSTMALLHPKYYGLPPPLDADDHIDHFESSTTPDFDETRYEDDTLAGLELSGLESESRDDECEDGCEEEQRKIDPIEGRLSSASSSDFEEVTDSFATHDKGNSASNTDSEIYRAEFPGSSSSRRRSSEAISTPLSARSPSLSAFTSDDEGETCGLLKTVSEENENSNTLKDAESQTEIILRAKPVLVEDEVDNEECLPGDDSQTGIFVATKRTIFTPIVIDDESVSDKIVLIEQDLKSPSLVKNILQQIPDPPRPSTPRQEDVIITDERYYDNNKGTQSSNPSSPRSRIFSRPPPPRIVEMTPKIKPGLLSQHSQPPTTAHRPFPKMGKIPVWCSPLGARRHLGDNNGQQRDLNDTTTRTHSTSVDFTIDRFLLDSRLLAEQDLHSMECQNFGLCSSASTSKIPIVTPRLGRRNTSAAVAECGLSSDTKGEQTRPGFLLPARSSSFRFRRADASSEQEMIRPPIRQQAESSSRQGFYSHLRNRVGSVVTKSQSTGSIKSKIGKAFSNLTNKITGGHTADHGQSRQLIQEARPIDPTLEDDGDHQPSTSRKSFDT